MREQYFFRLALLFLALFLPCIVVAQSSSGGNYQISHSVVAGGASPQTTGGTYTLDGTVGQASAGTLSSNGTYNVLSGFWASESNSPVIRKTLDFNADARADYVVISISAGLKSLSVSKVQSTYISKMPDKRFQAGVPTFKILQHQINYLGSGSDYTWEVSYSDNSGTLSIPFGNFGDFPVPGQFTSDNKTDIAIWRPSDQMFHILTSESNYVTEVTTVATGNTFSDPTVLGDYTGDGIDDPCVFTGTQWIYLPSNGDGTFGSSVTVNFGQIGDFPNPGDYNGDGKNDFSVERRDTVAPNSAHIYIDYNGTTPGVTDFDVVFREHKDVLVPGDYDGDGKTDIAVVDVTAVANIHWAYLSSAMGMTEVEVDLGNPLTGYQTQGDYDGDGVDDMVVWEAGVSGMFRVRQSSNMVTIMQNWGTSADYPVGYYQSH